MSALTLAFNDAEIEQRWQPRHLAQAWCEHVTSRIVEGNLLRFARP